MINEPMAESGPKSDLSHFTERIRTLVGGIPVARYARECGINESALRSYLGGKSEPGLFNLQKIVAHSGVEWGWLCDAAASEPYLFPDQAATVITTDGNAVQHAVEYRSSLTADYVELPLYDITAGAGAGKWNDNVRIKSRLAFRRDWLSTTVGSGNNLSLITVDGDSMEPTLKSGSVVMIRDNDTFNFNDGIYFMLHNGRHVIKRLQRKAINSIGNGKTEVAISVMSDNPAYPPVDVTLRQETIHENNILGRAVWLGVKLP